jgi:hypothetical protein
METALEEEVPEDSRIHKVERTAEITGKFVIPYITTDKTKAESPVSAHATEIRQEERRKLEAAGEEDPDTQIWKDEREVETAGDQDVPVTVLPFFKVSHGSDKMAAQSRSVFQAHYQKDLSCECTPGEACTPCGIDTSKQWKTKCTGKHHSRSKSRQAAIPRVDDEDIQYGGES